MGGPGDAVALRVSVGPCVSGRPARGSLGASAHTDDLLKLAAPLPAQPDYRRAGPAPV